MMVMILTRCVNHASKKQIIIDTIIINVSLGGIIPFINIGLNALIINVWYMNMAKVYVP